MATIDNLTLEITANSTSAVNSLNNLSTALGKLKTNLPTQAKLESSAKGFKALKDEISKLSLSAKNLDRIKAIGQIGNALSKLGSVSPANIKKSADNLNALQGAISHISDAGVERIERLASAFQKLAKANKNMGGLGSTRRITNALAQANPPISTTPADSGVVDANSKEAVGNLVEGTKTATINLQNFWTKFQTIRTLAKKDPISLFAMSEDTKQNEESIKKLGETLGMSAGAVSTFLKTLGKANIVIGIATTAFGLLGKAINRIVSPIKNFVNSLKRIAMYRLLRSAIKAVTQGIKEGIQNLALYSKALEGLDAHNANNVLSRYASEFLYFKNAIATAIIPVLRALIPYVETAINTLIKFIDVLAQVGSAIFGTQYTKAKYFWVDYADSLDNASGKAKKLHHQLAGFDELNNLTANSGGSGSDKLEDARNMFEEGIISPKIKNFVDNLKNKLATIKEIIQPYVDNVKEIGNGLKQKVAPQVKRILDNVKKIWNDYISPMWEGFFKGFFEGITGESFKKLPDILELVTEKLADLTDGIVDFADSIPNDKVKTFSERLGFITAVAISNINPLNRWVQEWEFLKKALEKLQTYIDSKVSPALQTLGERTEKTRFAFALFYNNILNLENPTSALSRKIEELKGKFDNLKTGVDLVYFSLGLAYDKFINLQNPTSYLSTLLSDLKDKMESVRNKFEEAKSHLENVKNIFKFIASYVLDSKNRLSDLKAFLDRTNIFKKGEDDAKPFVNILEDIVDIVDWFTRLGKIAIKFGIELTGLNDLKTALDRIAKALDMEDLKKKLQDNLSGVGDFDYSGKDDTSGGRATLPSDERDKGRNRVTHRATGGFVTRGDLFIANEAGAEMIGKIGGDTAVANNNQITEAIAQATYTAMSKALSENGGTINLVVEGDGDKMFKVFQKKQREYQRTTGLAY